MAQALPSAMARAADPAAARDAATQIVKRLRSAGHTAYFAGGCVRDELLGLSPTDYDVATDAVPQRVRELFQRTAEVGVAFGVVLVREGDAVVEVATFRSDGPYSDARRPDAVHFSDPQSDARRRDFTINALFLDPVAAADAPSIHGHVVDFVGGLADLKARVLRAVGDADKRLAEDHLRALRAVRFASRLAFAIDPATQAAIKRHTQDLRGVSRERIGDELRRMMAHASRAQAIATLQRLGLDAPVLEETTQPEAAIPTLAGLPGAAIGRGGGGGPPYPVCLAAWAMDRYGLAKSDRSLVTKWRAALNLSNEETEAFADILIGFMGLSGQKWLSEPLARQKRVAAKSWFPAAVQLLAVREPEAAARIGDRVVELGRSPGGIAPPALLNGDDLVAMGMQPGRRFKTILDGVYDAQLEGRVRDRAGAMELARRLGV